MSCTLCVVDVAVLVLQVWSNLVDCLFAVYTSRAAPYVEYIVCCGRGSAGVVKR
jgi:hypothetical protein